MIKSFTPPCQSAVTKTSNGFLFSFRFASALSKDEDGTKLDSGDLFPPIITAGEGANIAAVTTASWAKQTIKEKSAINIS